jgi:thymidylate synthase (FAD)
MRIEVINQSHEILKIDNDPLQMIEKAARTCYKSEKKITKESAHKFVKKLKDNKHNAMIEFGDMTVKFITDRGIVLELVRHRICSFANESSRYVNYNKKGFQFIRPVWCSSEICGEHTWEHPRTHADIDWVNAMFSSAERYEDFCENGWKPEQARSVLPNSLKSEIVVKANLREWIHIFKLRTSKKAHPQMRALMIPLLKEVQTKIPVLFDGIL